MRTLLQTARRWLRPLEGTPLHPQWLVLRQRERVRAWVKGEASGRTLDIGCGDSPLRRELKEWVDYVGIDYPVTVALGYSGDADVLADARSLPVATSSIDTVLFLDVLEHLQSPSLAVEEATRVLRPGGKCLVHVPFLYPEHDAPHDYQRWTQNGLAALFGEAGMRAITIRPTTSALESSFALCSIAIVSSLLDAIRQRSLLVLALFPMMTLIPALNCIAWFVGRAPAASCFMPFSFIAVFVKGPR